MIYSKIQLRYNITVYQDNKIMSCWTTLNSHFNMCIIPGTMHYTFYMNIINMYSPMYITKHISVEGPA